MTTSESKGRFFLQNESIHITNRIANWNALVQTCIWLSWCQSLSLASLKYRLVLPFWYRFTWVVPEKRPLNVCCTLYRGSSQFWGLATGWTCTDAVPGDLDGRCIFANGEKAAKHFCRVEELVSASGTSAPFTWLFIRPPWATTGACCKECVFTTMNVYVNEVQSTC